MNPEPVPSDLRLLQWLNGFPGVVCDESLTWPGKPLLLSCHGGTMHFPVLLWLMIVVVDVVCAVFCGSIAARKGYSPLLFSILGLFFFFFTLIVVLLLPAKRTA